MCVGLCFLLFAFNWIIVYSQIPPTICLNPVAFGKTCTTAEPAIRYHFDNETGLCMAFKFKGCDGNENRFDTELHCNDACKPTSVVGCPVKTNPVVKKDGKILCKDSEECGSTGYCSKRLAGGGICCSKTVREILDSDYDPACGTGRVVVKLEGDQVLIGKNCGSSFCPTGSKCRKGTYFSTCCKKV